MPTIQFRRGTAAQWRAANPILNAGEPGFETDSGQQKIGDGSTLWADLPYIVDETCARGMIEDAISHSDAITSPDVRAIRVVTQTEFDSTTPVDDVLYVIVG